MTIQLSGEAITGDITGALAAAIAKDIDEELARWDERQTDAPPDPTDETPPAANARFTWFLQATCPFCGWVSDLAQHDADGRYSDRLFEYRFKELEGDVVTCHECGRAFRLGEIIVL